MRTAYLAVAALAVTLIAIKPGAALEAPAALNIPDIRLLPPVAQPPVFRSPAFDQAGALRILQERHPEVFTTPSPTGRYMALLVLHADGRVERSELQTVDNSELGTLQQSRGPLSPDITGAMMTILRKGVALPDGSIPQADVTVHIDILPTRYDPSRAVSRVQQIVRERHADLLLPANGQVLNRLTVFLTEDGRIEREVVEATRFDALRRAPLEDDKFAERMAERFAKALGVDVQKIGVVGFTYVEEGMPRFAIQPDGSRADTGDRRTLLVQYAWPRKPGDTGPSMPMAAAAQQQPKTFDTAAALALAQYHFSDAFAGPETPAGTPTIVLNAKGEVLRTGRVQYRSGEIHENSLQQQLMPGIRLDQLVSPTLKDASGASAVITFAWVTPAG